MKEVEEFHDLGIVLIKYGSMEGEVMERAVKGGQVIGSNEGIKIGRSISMAAKWGLRNSIELPSSSET